MVRPIDGVHGGGTLNLRNGVIAATVAAALTIAGCSHHPEPAAGASREPAVVTGPQLRDLLLTATQLPTGLPIMLDPVASDDRPPASADSDPCADVINAYSLVEAVDTAVGWARVATAATDGPRWMAGEALSSHHSGGAEQVLAAIRALAVRCPTHDGPLTTHISVADGPKLGDQSVRVKARTSSTTVPGAEIEADAIVIRETPGVSRLDEVAAAAYARFASVS